MDGPPDTESIPLAKPEIGAREEELVLEVLRSGRLSLGPMAERFERDFAAWLGVEDAVAVSSGTTALHLGVRALGWGPGDEVLTSPFTFVASANCLLYEGVKPVFCDVDPETLNLDPATAAAAVGERTVGILPIHIFGYPAAMPELEALADKHGLGLLEDACQALGAVDSEGRKVGARGHLATFAFYANKQLTTGEGGMIVPPDAATAARLRSERNQGRAVDMGWLDHDRLGFNYRLSDLAAALGVAQLERLEGMLSSRSRVAALYENALSAADFVVSSAYRDEPRTHRGGVVPIAGRGEERRSWFVYAVQLPEGVDRDATIARLAERGVASKAYLPCIHLFPHLRELGYGEGQFPVAEAAAARSLALPFFPAMSESQVGRVCESLAESIS
jgi:perosamine synthetase